MTGQAQPPVNGNAPARGFRTSATHQARVLHHPPHRLYCGAAICPASERNRASPTAGTAHHTMKQPATRALFEYWDALRGTRPAPDRSDIDPGAIRSCLANTFVLAADAAHGHPFRIAGTSVCALFGSELTRTPFEMLWAAGRAACGSRPDADRDGGHADGVVAGVTGRNAASETLDLEMILLPLARDHALGDGSAGRVLGALTALRSPYWLGPRPVQSLHLGDLRFTGAAGATAHCPLAATRRCAGGGFVFYPAAASRISRNFQG